MLEKTVGHLLESEAHVLAADFLGHHQLRYRRPGGMRAAHEPRQHGGITHAGVEHPQCGWCRADVAQLLRRAVRDLLLLVAGVDEGQVLLAIVVEAERRGPGLAGHRGTSLIYAAARPAARSRVIRATCSPWNLHMSSSSGLGMRISAPAPVMELAP